MTAKRLADLLILGGLAIATAGLVLVWLPIALIVLGAGLAAFGALAIEVKP
jgi:hypothetical protein